MAGPGSGLEKDTECALRFAHEGLAAARRSGKPEVIATALGRLADAYDVAGDIGRCRELLEQGLDIARGTPNQTVLSTLLNNAAEAAMYFDDWDTARDRLEEVLALGQAREDRTVLVSAMSNLGLVLLAQGDPAGAEPILRDALGLVERVGAPVSFAATLLACAVTTSALGDAERAAALHGAADAVLAEIGTAFEPLESRRRAKSIAELRSRIGEDRFNAAYRRGGSLSREEVLALAG